MGINTRTYKKIILKFLKIVEIYDIREDKFGGPGKIVQVDETALNFKIKSHRGRAPTNKTDALCIVEFDRHISRAFACVIADKKASIIMPMIYDNVELGSIIHTDEHKSYSRLNDVGFIYDTVCHKYESVNGETGSNTQAVESFDKELNFDIKRRKGVLAVKRPEFLKEFIWKFNNKERRFMKICELIKIKF
jgi:transposase-like protein